MATTTTFVNSINGKGIYAKRAEKTATGVDIDSKLGALEGNISSISTALASKEDSSNKKQSINDSSTTDFPSSKAVADFVNSSVSTNTANYISNNGEPFTSVAQLEAYSGTVTNNDYAFVTGTDSEGNTYYDRYKATVNGSTVTWAKEYRLNNSSFTAAQWATINSGATADIINSIPNKVDKVAGKGLSQEDFTTTLKNKLDGIEAGAEVNVQPDWNQTDDSSDSFVKNKPTKLSDFTNDLATDDEPTKDSNNYAKSGGIYAQLQVAAQALNQLKADIKALNDRGFKDITAESIRLWEVPVVGDVPMISNGAGAPTVEPGFSGQLYLNTTTNVFYYAKGTASTSDWVPLLSVNDVTSTYSPTGDAPVNGKAVAQAVSSSIPTDPVPTKNSSNFVTSGTLYNQFQVVVQSLNELFSSLESVINRENYGDLKADSIALMESPIIGNAPMISSGSDAPTGVPHFAGQIYINTTNNSIYVATNKDNTTYWHEIVYTSKAASSGGTALSLVTTGEKNTWNSAMQSIGTTADSSDFTGNESVAVSASGKNITFKTIAKLRDWLKSSKLVDNADLGQGYGTCDTAAATTAKVVALSGYVLSTGGIVAVKFTYAVPASATMNINSQGAKSIFYRGAAITAGVIKAGDIATFIYDGTQYQLLSIDSGEQEMTEAEVTDLLDALT